MCSSMVSRRYRLSGTPAEAGVRARLACSSGIRQGVSVEPPPKQGCEDARHTLAGTKRVSVEPPPKQGCELLLEQLCSLS